MTRRAYYQYRAASRLREAWRATFEYIYVSGLIVVPVAVVVLL